MSVRPSAIPSTGALPSRPVPEGEQLPLERLLDRVEARPRRRVSSSPVDTVRIVGSWRRYGAGNVSSTDPPTKWNRTSSRIGGYRAGSASRPSPRAAAGAGPRRQTEPAHRLNRPRLHVVDRGDVADDRPDHDSSWTTLLSRIPA
jgi:hypothetical protein